VKKKKDADAVYSKGKANAGTGTGYLVPRKSGEKQEGRDGIGYTCFAAKKKKRAGGKVKGNTPCGQTQCEQEDRAWGKQDEGTTISEKETSILKNGNRVKGGKVGRKKGEA